MPKSKSSDVRMWVIDRCLSDRSRQYTTAQIFEACNKELEERDFYPITAKNSIRNDMEQIERIYQGAVIESYREGRNIYYRYADPKFSIYKTPLKPDEIIQLTQTLRLLSRFKGMPHFEWVNEISKRLGKELKLDEVKGEVVGFDENLRLEGMNNFTPLFNAIVDKQALKLTYKSFKHSEKTRKIVHPYFLKQFNKRWFLIAWDDELNYMANFAFDRILNIKNAAIPYKPTAVDFFKYFDNVIGVTIPKGAQPQQVKLWVSPSSWPYIRTKPLHNTQRVLTENEQGTIITFTVYLNYELEQQIMYFGENVKVIEPKELVEKVKNRLKEAAEKYF